MTKLLLIFLLLGLSQASRASFSNYNSILIGERAAGLGGAFTALTGDPSACAFYNPATLARMEGSTLSASVSLYNKYATSFGSDDAFAKAPLRINQGTITPVPSSSGSVYSFRNFALGLTIASPDFNFFTGEVDRQNGNSTFINLKDESLWVGGSIGLNVTEKDSVGFTLYYTSRTYNLLTTVRQEEEGVTSIFTEEKGFTHNSLVYILGYFRKFNENLTTGVSFRLPSLPISGVGSFHSFFVSTNGDKDFPVDINNSRTNSNIPGKVTWGLAYEVHHRWLASIDLSYYGSEEYFEFGGSNSGDKVIYNATWNINVGGEYFWNDWLAIRTGLFTNNTSALEIPDATTTRMLDHIPMWGFSTNVAIFTSPSTRFTLGGYYTGGQGWSTHGTGTNIRKVKKSNQVFSFLVGTTFQL